MFGVGESSRYRTGYGALEVAGDWTSALQAAEVEMTFWSEDALNEKLVAEQKKCKYSSFFPSPSVVQVIQSERISQNLYKQ